MKKIIILEMVLCMLLIFSSCTDSKKQNINKDNSSSTATSKISNTSKDTIATPNEFGSTYNYGSGKISEYSESMMLKKMTISSFLILLISHKPVVVILFSNSFNEKVKK